MIVKFEDIQQIVLKNPNKARIDKGRDMSKKLMMHVNGTGMTIKKCEQFVSEDIYKVQSEYAVSNVDLFARVLQQEEMVFMARGGSSYFGLSDDKEMAISGILDNISYGLSLRKWIKTFALQAYRCDPMGVFFIEIDEVQKGGGEITTPSAYPTYKSIESIYDYKTNGRTVEYICFQLTVAEAKSFGISDDDFENADRAAKSEYFRFVDDAKDLIVKRKEGRVSLAPNISQQNPLPNKWRKTPAIIASDIIMFNDPQCFLSPLWAIVELADTFLYDRSVRDLQKKLHGFAKAIEPLLTCPTCNGDKLVGGNACPACTTPEAKAAGATQGSGFKLKTKVADVAKFPLDILEKTGFDFNKIFGYVSPDIKGWEKQDMSLADLEIIIKSSYWGIATETKTSGPATSQNNNETATKTDINQRPIEARLNATADWAEKTEKLIAWFIAKYWYKNDFRNASISYGRDYVLRTPEELMETYQAMRTKGAPDFSLDEALEKYYIAKYESNPGQLQKYLKMLDVEPFPHNTPKDIEMSTIVPFEAKCQKRYFGEWANTIVDAEWIKSTAAVLRGKLAAYVTQKEIKEVRAVDPVMN